MKYKDTLTAFLNDNAIPFFEGLTGADCTTFRTGGRIGLLAEPGSVCQAAALLRFAEGEGIPYYVIGNGSNLLVPDEGFDELMIRFAGELAGSSMKGDVLVCGAGASMAASARGSVLAGFEGLEWAAGIPGTVGGAVAMNAGAYGGEIKQVLKSVKAYRRGELIETETEPEKLGYRYSAYAYPDMTVLEASFKLRPDSGSAKARMDELNARRREKQPLNYPSAGSTFKRPEGHYAGALIEGAGLKGFSVGGACVSEKHAGFVINRGGATSSDIIELINRVRSIVFDKYGVMLEPEVKILGR